MVYGVRSCMNKLIGKLIRCACAKVANKIEIVGEMVWEGGRLAT